MTPKQLDECIEWALNNKPDDDWLIEKYAEWYVPYYALMYRLAQVMKPKLSVELGVHNGRGASSLALGYQDGIVIGVDPDNKCEDVVIKCPNFKFIQDSSTSSKTIKTIESHDMSIDILHYDTEHNYGQIKVEDSYYNHLLKKGSILLFDDIHACEDGVLEAIKTLVPTTYLRIVDDLHPGCGYAVGIRGESSKDPEDPDEVEII